ncbi:hypothetical protein [Mesorhizobium captivum]|uniref:hypothetical protein n=1 Tax=Mesorhizobium captivum TaxID=3072319 RepID=UPI002A243DB4|nr:hypothetical protein [Mesorhizobium sp. VK23E]MDX8514963.1 hypothetical protein [Mesorhizobium sp. VK23E]
MVQVFICTDASPGGANWFMEFSETLADGSMSHDWVLESAARRCRAVLIHPQRA